MEPSVSNWPCSWKAFYLLRHFQEPKPVLRKREQSCEFQASLDYQQNPVSKGKLTKNSQIPYSNPGKRTMKKASLHVQQYTAITAHPSRLEIRVSLPPPAHVRCWTQGLKHVRTVTETCPQPFLAFCCFVLFLSQELTQLARISLKPWITNLLPQPPVYLGAQACTFRPDFAVSL